MKCPLLKAELKIDGDIAVGGFTDCLEGECAWWSDAYKSCAVLRIAYHIGDLVEQVEQLNDGIRLVK